MRSSAKERNTASVMLTLILFTLLITTTAHLPPMNGEGRSDLSSIYWPMIGRNDGHTNQGERAERGVLEPVVKWSNGTDSLGAVAGDVSGNILFDGVTPYTVIGLVESNQTHMRIRDAETGELAWEVDVRKIEGRTANRLNVAPALSDVDSDGELEIVCVVYYLNQFQVALFEPVISRNATGFHWSGTNYYDERVWLSISGNLNMISEQMLPESSPMLRDISGDGVEDVVIGSGNTLYCFYGNNGTLNWFREVGPIGEDISTCSFYDGTGPTNRLVVNSLTSTGQSLRTTLITLDGDHLKNVSVPLGSPLPYQYTGLVPMPVVGDVTGDGLPDIIITYPSRPGSGRLVVYSYSLTEQLTISGILGNVESSPALGDADSDGDLEIFIHSRYATTSFWMRMICYDIIDDAGELSASALWTVDRTMNLNSRLFSSPLLCDLDEDDVVDGIFIGNGRIYAISSSGQNIWNLTVQGQPLGFQGVVGDLGTDDFTDIYIDGKMISQQVVDLSVKQPWSSNIYLGDPKPVEGRTTTVNCIVQNRGTSPARDVEVAFLDSIEGAEATIISTTTVDEVTTTAEATVQWTPEGAGNHTITVVVDPNQTIIETDETNNEGSHFFTVGEAFADLTVHDIKFRRGDGVDADTKRLVEGDNSTIVVQVANIGEKAMSGADLSVTVNGTTVPGAENVPVGDVPVGVTVDVPVLWTPPEVEYTPLGTEFLVEASIDTSGLDDLDPSNNFGSNTTRVKSAEPIAGFEIRGTVYDPEGSPEDEVSVTATNMRTSGSLEDTTNVNGAFNIFFPQTDYLDSDEVRIYAHKGNMWAGSMISLYSEDGVKLIELNLTDVPTLSLSISIEGPQEMDVMPGADYSIRFQVENNGNIEGNLSFEKELSGNSSLSPSDLALVPGTITLFPGSKEDVELRFAVPGKEPPNRTFTVLLIGELTSNSSSIEDRLELTFTVGTSKKVYHEFRGERNITLDANDIKEVSFPVYILNRGNVDISYNLSVDQDLMGYSEVIEPSGVLGPSKSVLSEVVITYAGSDERLRGDILLKTSGDPSSISWRITLDLEFPNLEAGDIISLEDPNIVLEDTVTLLATVKNSGKVDVKELYCAFYENGEIIDGTTVNDLGAGESVVVDTVLWTPVTIGDKVVSFEIDPDGVLAEDNEEDNLVSTTFTFYPDLSITRVEFEPSSVSYGDEVTVTVSVKNSGNAHIRRGFTLEIRSGSAEGELLTSEEYDLDVLAGGEDVKEVGLIFHAPEKEGPIDVYVVVAPIMEEEKATGNNEFTSTVEIYAPGEDGNGYLVWIIVAAVAVLLVLGAALYIWRVGLPSSPPPEEEEEKGEEEEPEEEEEEEEEEPFLEMSLDPPSPEEVPLEEDVVVAEVLDVASEEEELTGDLPEEDEEGLIAEV
ncbi:MAG: CARDB domain-containing protein [Thermoplasmatota archaeon]